MTYINIHILQTLPPSCINRDRDGQPKTAIYGGVNRLRISSQAWKKAARDQFHNTIDSSELGMRSREIANILTSLMTTEPSDTRAINLATAMFKAMKIPMDAQKPGISSAVQFISNIQWKQLAAYADQTKDIPDKQLDKHFAKLGKTIRQMLAPATAIDVALFGRMSASDDKTTPIDVNAATQVAHAISVDPAETETDFLAAVDDYEHASGAGMIATGLYTSGTVYRYAAIDVNQLNENLGDTEASQRAITTFVTTFTRSMPSGKEHAYAQHTLPAFVMTEIRDDMPVNLVEAFRTPIRGTRIMEDAVSALCSQSLNYDMAYELKPAQRSIVALPNVHDSIPDEWKPTLTSLPKLAAIAAETATR